MKLSIFSFLLVSVLVFSSCEKGNFFKDKDDKKEEKSECFELVYPLTYLMPDGYTISGDDKESLGTRMKEWYENNPEIADKPILQYPMEVIFKNALVKTIQNEAEMIEVKKDCD